MRVIVKSDSVVPRISGGLEHFTSGLLRGLAEQAETDDEIIALIARGTAGAWREAVGSASGVRFEEVVSTASLTRPRLWIAGQPRLRQLVNSASHSKALRRWVFKFRDTVEARSLGRLGPDVTYYPFHLSTGRAEPSVMTIHDLRALNPELDERGMADLLRANILRADALVTSWPHPYHDILKRFPEASSKLYMIPFPPMNPPPLESRGGSTNTSPYILYPAATTLHKNHRPLIEALAELRRTYDLKLICTGARLPPLVDELVTLAKRLNLDQAVEFRGFVGPEMLARLFAGASTVVIPSLWEAASGPIFEAFAYGKPIACSDIPPFQSQVSWTGADVAFFDPSSPSSIAAAVSGTIETPDRFIAGANAGAAFMRQFTWARTAQEYLDVFHSVVRSD